jgi:hypothetical protein
MTAPQTANEELAATLAEKLQTLLSALQEVDLPTEVLPAYHAAMDVLDQWHREAV